jgi:hypothetical protein
MPSDQDYSKDTSYFEYTQGHNDRRQEMEQTDQAQSKAFSIERELQAMAFQPREQAAHRDYLVESRLLNNVG